MPDIEFNLPAAQADKMLPLLEKVRVGAKGEERKAIDALIKKLTPQIEAGKEKAREEKADEEVGDITARLVNLVVGMLPQLKKRGLSEEVAAYVNTIDKVFSKVETDIKAATQKYAATLPKNKQRDANLPLNQFAKITARAERKIEKANQDLRISGHSPIQTNPGYTLDKKRGQMAEKSFTTALSIGAKAREWKDELDMAGLMFSDMNTHLKLGVALQGGNPSAIWKAYSMDTGCRDEMNEKVWTFINVEMDDNLRQQRAVRSRP